MVKWFGKQNAREPMIRISIRETLKMMQYVLSPQPCLSPIAVYEHTLPYLPKVFSILHA